jgi:redox-sensitive bicupin YhaK (pirin superfamily)
MPADEELVLLAPREVPLGGPRAMLVQRTLPHRRRRTIGAWCFIDAFGPDDVAASGGMVVPPHPHTGLQTVSWLFSGEVLHRDSLGSEKFIRPGQLNLMTAGVGIAHSEDSRSGSTEPLHGVQFWVALPAVDRGRSPGFAHHSDLPQVAIGAGRATVMLGSLAGVDSPATVHSPLIGAEISLPTGTNEIPVSAEFEHGLLPVDAPLQLHSEQGASVLVEVNSLLAVGTGRESLAVSCSEPTRLLLVGGAPFEEAFVMWWNFLATDHDGIVAARDDWQAQDDRFGVVPGGRPPLPAPTLPAVRLQARGRTH